MSEERDKELCAIKAYTRFFINNVCKKLKEAKELKKLADIATEMVKLGKIK